MKKLYFALCLIFVTSCTLFRQSDEVWIKNDENEALYLKIEGLNNASSHKLAIIQHGLASNSDHQVVQTAKQAFLDNDYVVITFDSRYSLGRSGDEVKYARLTTFNEDLATVVAWAKDKPFYHEPFALSGHSLGGASVLKYSAEHPKQVATLIPIAPVVSGKLWEKSCFTNMADFCHQWQQKGVYEYYDMKIHKQATIPFAIVNASKSYDANLLAPKITAKTLLIAGEDDIIIPSGDINKLALKLKTATQEVAIPLSNHNFETKQNQQDLYKAIYNFLKEQ